MKIERQLAAKKAELLSYFRNPRPNSSPKYIEPTAPEISRSKLLGSTVPLERLRRT